ncbi:MAG: hypothetical protein P4L71_11020 [Acetobacteraceae bacterium]|nr:hypothetical protein [Acetobacteraceae bacterium]
MRDAGGELADCLHFLGLPQLVLGPAPGGDVGVQRDESASDHRAAAQLQDLAVGALAFDCAGGDAGFDQGRAPLRLLLDVDRPELPRRGLRPQDILQLHAHPQHVCRHAGIFRETRVPLDQAQLGIEHHQPVGHARNGGLPSRAPGVLGEFRHRKCRPGPRQRGLAATMQIRFAEQQTCQRHDARDQYAW